MLTPIDWKSSIVKIGKVSPVISLFLNKLKYSSKLLYFKNEPRSCFVQLYKLLLSKFLYCSLGFNRLTNSYVNNLI